MNSASFLLHSSPYSPPAPSGGPRQISFPRVRTACRSSILVRCPPSIDLTIAPPPPPPPSSPFFPSSSFLLPSAKSECTSLTASRQSSRSRGDTDGRTVRTSPDSDRSIRSSPLGGAPPPPPAEPPPTPAATPPSVGGDRSTASSAAGRTRRADECGRTASSRTRPRSIRPLGRERVRARTGRSTSMTLLLAPVAPVAPAALFSPSPFPSSSSSAGATTVTFTPNAECSPAMPSSTSASSSSLRRPPRATSDWSLLWRRRRSSTRDRYDA
mmetsp:Transcript_3678/g.6466  ORF Transcript_3678/g.6466 Transcript_3678/m.6466 type:complete len:270 (-) Transcript_3678:1030-1839(-)